jgi:hypothetical protein
MDNEMAGFLGPATSLSGATMKKINVSPID